VTTDDIVPVPIADAHPVTETTPPPTGCDRVEVVHACPPHGAAMTPCCARTPFELPRTDRMTLDPGAVTCTPTSPPPLPLDWAHVVTVKPGDVIVLTFPQPLTDQQVERVRDDVKPMWPHNQIAVLDNGAHLTIARPTPQDPLCGCGHPRSWHTHELGTCWHGLHAEHPDDRCDCTGFTDPKPHDATGGIIAKPAARLTDDLIAAAATAHDTGTFTRNADGSVTYGSSGTNADVFGNVTLAPDACPNCGHAAGWHRDQTGPCAAIGCTCTGPPTTTVPQENPT